jgi:hypothetical protein
LVADLDQAFPDTPNKQQLATYLASWMLEQIVLTQQFIGLEQAIHIAEDWLAQKKAKFS